MGFLRMSAGAIVWAAHFAALYGFTALACARGFPDAISWVAGAATLAALAAAGYVVARAFPGRADFSEWMTAAIAGVAIVAIVFEGIALAMVPACR
jgi:hypothetical protein